MGLAQAKLLIEAPVNGGRNYNGPKVAKFPPINHFFVFSFQRSGQNKGRCMCLGKDQAFYTSGVRDMIDPPRNKKMNARIVGRSENCSWPAASAVRRVPKCVFQCEVYSLRWNRTASWSAVAGQLPKSCFVIPMKHFLPAELV